MPTTNTRGNKLGRRVWDTYEGIVVAYGDAWQFLIGAPERVDSIACRYGAWVNIQSG
jgi:hypothetical protein